MLWSVFNLCIVLLGWTVIWLGTLPPAAPAFLLIFLGLIVCLMTLFATVQGWETWRANCDLPGAIEAFMDQLLSPADNEQFRRFARMYPEVRPWIAEAMDEHGDLHYDQAIPLAARINAYLDSLPEEDLKTLVLPNR